MDDQEVDRQLDAIERTLQWRGVQGRVVNVTVTPRCVRWTVATAGDAGDNISLALAQTIGRSVRTFRENGCLQVEVTRG